MPTQVVNATVTGTASTGPLDEIKAVQAAVRRISFDGVHLALGSQGVVLLMVLLFLKVPHGPGQVRELKLVVSAQSGLTEAEAALQIAARVLYLRASIAETGLLAPGAFVVEGASSPAPPAPATPT